jgi:hypothetical protein
MEKEKNKGGAGLNKFKMNDEQRKDFAKLAPYLSKKFLADYFGVSRPCFDNFLDENQDLLLLYKNSKSKLIAKASRTLIEKAFGDDDNPPDTTCLLFFLKTQTEGDYREVKEVAIEHSGTIDTKPAQQMTDEELKDNIAKAKSLRNGNS